jgi:hypothetical protein
VKLNATTDQPNFPEVDPRSNDHDNTLFIRSVLRYAVKAPPLIIDAAGRYAIAAGNYVLPTMFDSSGLIAINTDDDSRVAYGGNHGILYGFLKDIAGIEIRPDKIVSRRAYGVKATVSRITAPSTTTTQDVILNNYGIHGAQYGDDGEFTDCYFYDKTIPAGSIVLGGEIGIARRQLNRFDGLVSTGTSGLWVGGLNYVLEGDSVEEAVTKLDAKINTIASQHVETAVSDTAGNTVTITHNIGFYPQVTVIDLDTGDVVAVAINHTNKNEFTFILGVDLSNGIVICDSCGLS